MASKPAGCQSFVPVPDVTVGSVSQASRLRIVLVDNTCHQTYYCDGGHGSVVGSNPYQLDLADAGGFCERPGGTVNLQPGKGNLTATVTIG